MQSLGAKFFSPRFGFYLFVAAVGLTYGVAPALLYFFAGATDYYLKLSLLTLVALIALVVGYKLPVLDGQFRPGAVRVIVSSRLFNLCVWSFFFVFAFYTYYTAPSIPLISAIQGAGADELSQQRGDFFKGRTGFETILLYLSTIFTTVLIPYSLVVMFLKKSPLRYLFLFVAFVFCISFLQKSLFLNVFLPVMVCFALAGKLSLKSLALCLALAISVLMAAVFLSLGGGEAGEINAGGAPLAEYFSAKYLPSGARDYFIWRAFAVPLFTATDTLLVQTEIFKNDFLMGSTSLLISALTGMERVNIERYVFQHQFGSWNEIANANAVYITDAYVNFGWVGVIAFSMLVGQVFRWFRLSYDIAFKSLWPIFAFTLYSASLIGMLISNGFAYILFHALLIRISLGAVAQEKFPLTTLSRVH
ncbi:hypothetical protein QSV36_21630 [Pseudomonas sp. BCRC 81390]|uniref:hypothetical protein n=1 Tax=Pseudomonas sp. BCRC 81390 TaxID=3054778 RepID=UPI002593ADA4|nr:hypothetical protein [Pseudomonas sp. BCRC 81390]MDM3888179.1 hypothetical protein [Pseudomonas sp. BCRC 81390]